VELFGYLGGGMVAFSFLPQLIRVIRLRTANEISTVFASTMFAGCLIWTAYAFSMHQLPMIIFSVLNTSQTGLLLGLKYMYSMSQKKLVIDNDLARPAETVVSAADTQNLVKEETKQIEVILN